VEFLTAEDIARITKLSPEFVYQNRHLFGGVKFGRAVRFEKHTFEQKIKEMMQNECLQASGKMAVRVHDRGGAVLEKRVRNEASRPRRRSRRQKEPKADEFSVHSLVRQSLEGLEEQENEEISEGKR
jgi:hypothetical protein